jgi:GNAT superfamily N-acetyltransferase
VTIRSATRDDAPSISSLLEELDFPAPADVVARRLDLLHALRELVLVAERGGDVVGLVTVHVTPVLHRPTPVGRVTALVVARSARRSGVGRALLAAAEQAVASRGCALIEVTSHRRLVDAHAFYVALGWELTSFRFKKSLDPSSADR